MIINSSETLDLLRIRLALDILYLHANQKPTKEHLELLELCKSNNIEAVNEKIKNFSDYKDYIPNTSARNIAEDSMVLVDKLFKEKLVSKIHLKQIADVFSKYPTVQNEYEEELEEEPTAYSHLTPNMENNLNVLEKIFKMYNPKTMSPTQFKKFTLQFQDLSKRLGINKFQQYFDEHDQTITDMKISEINTAGIRPIYKTTFTLADSNSQETTQSIQEYAPTSNFSSTYYQNLCYSYLEAKKYSKISEDLIEPNTIPEKMSTFKECYEKLKEMLSKCKITISNDSIFYSSETEIVPELETNASKTSDQPSYDEVGDEPDL